MDPTRKVIADWLRREMKRLGWTPQKWATEAGTSPTNITRALKPDEKPVMTFKTQAALARAAQTPSALDFLSGTLPDDRPPVIPSEAALTPLLQALVPLRPPGDELPEEAARALAVALRYALAHLAETGSTRPTEDDLQAAARGAIVRYREACSQ